MSKKQKNVENIENKNVAYPNLTCFLNIPNTAEPLGSSPNPVGPPLGLWAF